jgi:hypothetical protein
MNDKSSVNEVDVLMNTLNYILKCVLIFIVVLIVLAIGAITYGKAQREKLLVKANVWFTQHHCVKSHYVSSKYDPIMIYKCDDGERTFSSIVEEVNK